MNINSVDFFRKQNYTIPATISMPVLVAWKLQNPENCGSLLRLADSVGFQKVWFVNSENIISIRKVKKIAGNSFSAMDFDFVDENEVLSKLPPDYRIVAVETAPGSDNIFQSPLPDRIVLVVGNEAKGIDAEFLSQCHSVVHIPLTGNCTSLNVSHAATVAAFEWLRQLMSRL